MFKKALGTFAIASTMTMLVAGTAYADIPFNQPVNGTATYYDNVGAGSCGTAIDASSQWLVAVSPSYWTASNPNADPLCQGVSVQVTYNGQTLTLPVLDKCAACDSTHVDLSEPAFVQLTGGTGLGNVPVTWEFVKS